MAYSSTSNQGDPHLGNINRCSLHKLEPRPSESACVADWDLRSFRKLCSLYVPSSANNHIISTYRNTNLTNLILLKRLLAEELWKNVMSTKDVNEAHDNLLRTLTLILNHTCPSKQSRCNKKRVFCDVQARRLKRYFLEAND
ncbi:hypothetical protein J6590_024082, partial [Homalodisca vitripennis]